MDGGSLIIKNAVLADENNLFRKVCVEVRNGITAYIGADIHSGAADDAEVLDARGNFIAAGFVDMHVHLRDPGFEYKEDIITGTRAAAAGGITTVACMPNTNPVCDCAEVFEYIIKKTRESGYCGVIPVCAITKGQAGAELADFAEYSRLGVLAVSDDGKPVSDSALMYRAALEAEKYGLLLISHCEDTGLAEGGVMNLGEALSELNMRENSDYKGIPAAAEDIVTARDIIIAEETGARLHIAHVSTKTSAELIRAAKRRGAKITAETCPHYFTLTDRAVLEYRVNAKMNPPLRSEEDRLAIIAALADGTIDCISTDHAPHSPEDKNEDAGELSGAANGITGFETSFALGVSALYKSGFMDLHALLRLYSSNPAKILGVDAGRIIPGAPACFTIFNTNEEFVFDRMNSYSKSRNTPFGGHSLYGKILCTVHNGRITHS